MKLGMISYCDRKQLSLEEFKKISEKGLSFVEFCVNVTDSIQDFIDKIPIIKEGMATYHLEIGSIGRWGSFRIQPDGNLCEQELANDFKLIDLCHELNCNVFVAGCNYIYERSLYENATSAIHYFEKLIEYGKKYDIKIAVYNCDWNNYIHNQEMWQLILGHLKDLWIKYDPSHSIYAKRDYLKEIKTWGKRFAHVHIKGTLTIDGERVDDPPAGLDQTDWRAFFATLYLVGYNGNLSLEPHSETWQGELGEKGLNYSIEYIKQFLITT